MPHADRERHDRVKRIFLEAQRLPVDDRAAHLDRACAGDPSLRAELESLFQESVANTEEMDRDIEAIQRTVASSGWDALIEQFRSRGPSHLRYDYQGEIARGGMGVIHRVYDRDAGRTLALKLMLDGGAADVDQAAEDRSLGRFIGEARITSRLDHPGVVPVHEIGVDGSGRVYFTMKLVRGEDLRAVFERVHDPADTGWTTTRALNVMLRVCEAMAYAHDKGIIHRDLKPGNVMVGAHGEAYVMDWGLARVLSESDPRDLRIKQEPTGSDGPGPTSADSPILTVDGSILGTPAYMPPEQARGETAQVGPAADVYAVGVMLYQLLAQCTPYHVPGEDNSPWTILARIDGGRPAPLAGLAPDAPPELVAIVERAMARSINHRYPDMTALAADLRAFLENRVVAAYQTGAWAEAKKWVQRNRALAVALAAGVLATAGLGFTLAWQQRRAADAVAAERDIQVAIERRATEAVATERDVQQSIATVLEEILRGASPAVHKGRDSTMLREMLDATVARMDNGTLQAAPQAEARLRRSIGQTYWELGAYDRAKTQHARSVEMLRKTPDADPLALAESLQALALTITHLNEFEAAERYAREAQRLTEHAAGTDDLRHAESLTLLGHIGMERGEYETSKAILEQALALRNRHAPAGDAKTVDVLTDLAQLCQNRGEYEESIRHNRDAADILARIDPEHPYRYMFDVSRAAVLFHLSRFDDAEQAYWAALEGLRAVMPENHPFIANALSDLGSLHEVRGEYDEARRLYADCLTVLDGQAHDNRDQRATLYHNLALVDRRVGDLDAAEGNLLQAIAIRSELFPDGDRSTAKSLHNYGVLQLSRGDLEAAQPLLVEALEMRRRLFAGDHPDVVLSLNNIGSLYMRKGDADAALEVQIEAVEMSRRLFDGAPNLGLVEVLEKIAYTYEHLDRMAEARESATEAIAMRAEVFGTAEAVNLATLFLLARVEGSLDGPAAALPRFQSALEAALGGSSPGTVASAYYQLGQCHLELERFQDAESALLSAWSAVDGQAGVDDERLVSAYLLIELYAAWRQAAPDDDHDAAHARWSRVLEEERGRLSGSPSQGEGQP